MKLIPYHLKHLPDALHRRHAEENPGEADEVESEDHPEVASEPSHGGSVEACPRADLHIEFVQGERDAVHTAPEDEAQASSVPQATEEHRDEEVEIGAQATTTTAPEWYVEVVPQPGGERDVPASPELGDGGGAVGRVEVDIEAEAEPEGYALQIYCDFSGYSDMAIGIALWLGFRFNINFDSPYRSATITEFWRRWHISLSSWLRDYLYIPLGGSRRGRLRTYLNLLITMLLGGLWHGASLRFILWGGMHGVALALHKLYMQICPWARPDGASMGRLRRYLGMFITFHFVCFAWIFFRMPTMEGIGQMFEMIRYEFHPEIIPQFLEGYWLVVTLIVLGFVAHFIPQRAFRPLERSFSRMPLVGQALLFALVVLLVVQFQSSGVQPFIYFQF